jgi:5-formyltetrahydrofolate cyclo-ligase
MIESSPPDGKTALRARLLALRDMLGSALGEGEGGGRAAEDLLRRRFLDGAEHLASSAVVAAYWPMRGEIDVLLLLHALAMRGHVTALPVVVAPRRPLLFRRWAPGDALAEGAYGTRHPVETAPEVRPHCLLVPLLAFDRRGNRLGYGGGFYDRTIAALRATGGVVTVGVAYAGQEVARVPAEPHDQLLDWVVTEHEVIRFVP